MFQKLDHIAIAVKDTEEALTFYRDTLRLPVLVSEVLEEVGVRLTHLDMGNVNLQLDVPTKLSFIQKLNAMPSGSQINMSNEMLRLNVSIVNRAISRPKNIVVPAAIPKVI